MVLGILGEFNHDDFNPLRWIVKVAAAATYIFMVYKDNEQSRLVFFLGWIGSIVGMIVVNTLTSDSENPEQDKVLERVSFVDIATQTCESMGANDRKAAHFESMKDCVDQVSRNMRGVVYFTLFLFMIVMLFITFHFTLVIYTHW